VSSATRIDVRAASGGQVLIRQGLLQARRLRSAPGVIRIALVASQALLLGGDEVVVDVAVAGPVRVELIETAGTVAYNMRGGSARWDAVVRLTDGAHLSWLAEPFVVASGADVSRSTTVDLSEDSTAALRESLVFGRTGESGGTLRSSTRISRGGRPTYAEDLLLGPAERAGWGMLAGHRCLDSITTVGTRLPESPVILQLEDSASLARWVGDDQHRSPLAELWTSLQLKAGGSIAQERQ
jgi:urease accessory protein